MNEKLLQRLHVDLSTHARASVGRHGAAFSLGFSTSEGRQIAAVAEETNIEGRLRISDGGESWSELVMGGYADPGPTTSERHALERLCSLHGLHWDNSRTELFSVVDASEVTDAVRRVTSASLAIDGWRAWYPDLVKDPAMRMSMVVRELVQLGPQTHWNVEPNAQLDGKKRRWTAGARLVRNRSQAVVAFFPEAEAEKVIERVMGWIYDVNLPLIIVANERVAKELAEVSELAGRAEAVPRLVSGTADLVLGAAERVAEAA